MENKGKNDDRRRASLVISSNSSYFCIPNIIMDERRNHKGKRRIKTLNKFY